MATHPPQTPIRRLEWCALIHIASTVVATTWAFGGNATWVQVPLAAWASVGAVIAVAGLATRSTCERDLWRSIGPLTPLALFNALVLVTCLTPLFREARTDGSTLLIPNAVSRWIPGAAVPREALKGLWIFDGNVLTCYNLVLFVRRRATLRGLLILCCANALALSVFGTLQKLTHATGLYFNRVPTPQPFFFASFVYSNHWGAFGVLMVAACIAIAAHHASRTSGRSILQGPTFGAILVMLIVAVTIPMSGSRACTIQVTLLLAGAGLVWLIRSIRGSREGGRSPAGTVAVLLALAVSLAGSAWYLAGGVIRTRVATTREQVAEMRSQGSLGSRSQLYRDSWRMARDRLPFGWGMRSYPYVFLLYNRQEPNPLDHLPIFFHDAHSDWIQAVDEHGLTGAALLALCAIVPLRNQIRRRRIEPLSAALFAGCGLVLAYAWVEFPFGNTAVVLTWWLCLLIAARHARLGVRESGVEAAGSGDLQ